MGLFRLRRIDGKKDWILDDSEIRFSCQDLLFYKGSDERVLKSHGEVASREFEVDNFGNYKNERIKIALLDEREFSRTDKLTPASEGENLEQ